MALKNKLLTWDDVIKRGWIGHNWCVLYKYDVESNSHVFVSCNYVEKVYLNIKDNLGINSKWKSESVEEYLRNWLMDRSSSLYIGLPSLMVSNLWRARNSTIFQDKYVSLEATTTITLSQVEEFKLAPKEQKKRNLVFPSLDFVIPWGYIDKAT